MTKKHKKPGWIQRFVRWFFGAPFQELPPEFGDPVLPKLRVFEAEAEEAQHHTYRIRGSLPSAQPGDHR